MKIRNINIEIPDSLHKQAKINAVVLNLNLKEYIIKAIGEKNKKHKEQ